MAKERLGRATTKEVTAKKVIPILWENVELHLQAARPDCEAIIKQVDRIRAEALETPRKE